MATPFMSTRVGTSCGLFVILSIAGTAGCAEGSSGTGGEAGSGASNPNGTTDASTTEQSSSTGVPTSCTFEPGFEVGAECGFFVKAGAPAGNDCSKAMPCATIGEAVSKVTPEKPRLFLCTTPIEEAVVLPGGVNIHGGFECGTAWTWGVEGRTVWTAPPDEIPLTFEGGTIESEVSGVDLSSSDATLPGGSSIVVFAKGGALRFSLSSIIAGDGAPGAPGAPAEVGAAGELGWTGGTSSVPGGGMGGASACNEGGAGAPINCGTECTAGLPTSGQPGVPSGGGAAGANGPTSCTAGDPGSAGTSGENGVHAVGVGTIDEAGFHPPLATDGAPGTHGGGGGGGGAKTTVLLGGGGGGGGGCGATAGKAGQTGGASLAIISLDTQLEFAGVTAGVGSGGDGDLGGASALGGEAGLAGKGGCDSGILCNSPQGNRGCAGGDGGVGGSGGAGGNGAGGHALIIAYQGTIPSLIGLNYLTPMGFQAGLAGPGASVGVTAVMLEMD